MIARRFVSHAQVLVRAALVATLGLSAVWTARAQAFEITAAQRAACTPDVMRLCSSELPNAGRVIACMRANKASVSAGCKAVIPAGAWSGPTRVAAR